MKNILLPVLAICFGGISFFAEASSPNIVYILADDMGYGDVQCLNPERGKIATPHMDRTDREGHVKVDRRS